jgi:hypothetical protein
MYLHSIVKDFSLTSVPNRSNEGPIIPKAVGSCTTTLPALSASFRPLLHRRSQQTSFTAACRGPRKRPYYPCTSGRSPNVSLGILPLAKTLPARLLASRVHNILVILILAPKYRYIVCNIPEGLRICRVTSTGAELGDILDRCAGAGVPTSPCIALFT